ncbi:MAG: DUF664 domain-containing protein, partial [Elusimicrobia bacterium]|nr:DUF664 domain-containing protein [Elusimicrobiota bacterium]
LNGATAQELEWQPAPGMNTAGMLLAHLAIVEVFWTQIALRGIEKLETEPVIGIGQDDDGMPLPEDGAPPQVLKGKTPAYYEDLLSRARAYLKEAAVKLSDADLDREVTRTRPDGTQRIVNVRWGLYHMLEHFSGHFGQILLLRHLYRATVGAASR